MLGNISSTKWSTPVNPPEPLTELTIFIFIHSVMEFLKKKTFHFLDLLYLTVVGQLELVLGQ